MTDEERLEISKPALQDTHTHLPMKWTKDTYWITDDSATAPLDFITVELDRTYWAAGRTRDIVEKSVRNSVVFSMFDGDRPVGFARLVTDHATFAWLCDVYVHPDFRGRGLGVWLMQCVMEHPCTHVRMNLLATRDAQKLYEKFGYKSKECMALMNHGTKPATSS